MASVTVLMKLSYLIDLISFKRRGEKITDYRYIRYFYGPFDRKINDDIQELIDANEVEPKSCFTGSGEEFIIYKNAKLTDSITENFAQEEQDIIDEVLESVKGYGAKALTEIAYKTKPMVALKATLGGTENLNETLDFSAN